MSTASRSSEREPISFAAELSTIEDTAIVRLPQAASEQLPSRGQVAVQASLDLAPDWPEPDVPADLAAALADAPSTIQDVWQDITPMARWEWVRWVQATANPQTRQRRVEVSLSKMDGGKRRPCCFDLASCTDPELAKSGKLREPS